MSPVNDPLLEKPRCTCKVDLTSTLTLHLPSIKLTPFLSSNSLFYITKNLLGSPSEVFSKGPTPSSTKNLSRTRRRRGGGGNIVATLWQGQSHVWPMPSNGLTRKLYQYTIPSTAVTYNRRVEHGSLEHEIMLEWTSSSLLLLLLSNISQGITIDIRSLSTYWSPTRGHWILCNPQFSSN